MTASRPAPPAAARTRAALAWMLGLLAALACALVVLAGPTLASLTDPAYDLGDPVQVTQDDARSCISPLELEPDTAGGDLALLPGPAPAVLGEAVPPAPEGARDWPRLKTPPPLRPPRALA